MEREVWGWLVPLVRRHSPARVSRRYRFDWSDILLTYLWAVLHTRPIYWACQPVHWPADLRPARLPTPSTMTRRQRDPLFLATLRQLLRHLQRGCRRGLLSSVDGKPFPVSRHSKDGDARFGRGAGGLAKGYKLHLIRGENERIEAFAIHPLNVDERVVARELVDEAQLQGYLLGDAHYHDSKPYARCRARGVQLVSPRGRKGAGVGHRKQEPTRLRSIDMLEHSHTGFGPQLLEARRAIERTFGHWTSSSLGAFTLPPWVRRLARVERWLTASLLLFALIHRRKRAG